MRVKVAAIMMFYLVALALPACQSFFQNPQQRSDAHALVDAAHARREITDKQADAMHEAIDNDQPVDWEMWGLLGLNLIAVGLGVPLQINRGVKKAALRHLPAPKSA